MFASRAFQKIGSRSMGTVAKTKGVFREKNFYEAWCSDSGAYPVMGVIVFACVFSTGTMLWFVTSSPDARVSRTSRKTLFRGEFYGKDHEDKAAAH